MEELVRCKDCKYCSKDTIGDLCCGNISPSCIDIVFVRSDGCCPEGERKEDNK